MATAASNKNEKKERYVPEWIWEILIFVTVSPALVYGLASLKAIPVA